MRWLVVPCADRNDRWSCRFADRTIALSTRDDDELFRRYHRRADQLIPVAFVDRFKRDNYSTDLTAEKPLCMFLGAYFPANVEGIEWFVKNVLPHVNIRMQIVGKGMEKLKEADWMRVDIEVLSNVPNLEPLFEAADIMVLPIFKGSGMKVKTCESLMYGKNIIGTDEAFEGYEITEGVSGWRCNTAEEYIECIHAFCEKPQAHYNIAARRLYEEKYSEEAVVSQFKNLCAL